MEEITNSAAGKEPYIRLCQCAVCNKTFAPQSRDVSETAQKVASHWNEEHGNILENSYTAYHQTEQERHELGDGVYKARTKTHYLTAYDVLAIEDGEKLFKPAFIQNTLLCEVCEDCLTPIEQCNDYTILADNEDTPVTKYLCPQCEKERKIKQRKANNRQLTAFERA